MLSVVCAIALACQSKATSYEPTGPRIEVTMKKGGHFVITTDRKASPKNPLEPQRNGRLHFKGECALAIFCDLHSTLFIFRQGDFRNSRNTRVVRKQIPGTDCCSHSRNEEARLGAN